MFPASQPKVSVLVPIYNVEQYLEQCLDSIVNQTLRDIEIILINDGSTDSCPEICDRYAANDPRIKVIHKPNSGYGASMNIGLDNATSEYIGIVESDDFAELSMFENLYRLSKEYDADIVKSDFYRFYSKEQTKNARNSVPKQLVGKSFSPRKHLDVLLMPPAIWSALYKKDFLLQNDISFLETPGASYQDTSFNMKVLISTNKMVLTDCAYLNYRCDNENSSVKNTDKIFYVCDEWAEIESFAKQNALYEEIRFFLAKIKWNAYIWNLNRLSPENVWPFVDRFSKEYQILSEQSSIDNTLYSEKEYKKLLLLTNDSYGFYEQYMEQSNKILQYDCKVSVIIAAYNSESFLVECLDSILDQTLSSIEIICVNDGSTDRTFEILKQYATNDKRIYIINQENKGQSVARNKAMEIARGEYIAFIDSDDWIELDCLQKLYFHAKKHNADMLMFQAINYIQSSGMFEQNPYYMFKYLPEQWDLKTFNYIDCIGFLEKIAVSACLTIYKNNFLKQNSIYWLNEKCYYEDNLFFTQALFKADRMSIIKEVLYNRRIHAASVTQNPIKHFVDFLKISQLVIEFLENLKIHKNIISSYKKQYTSDIMHRYALLPLDEQVKNLKSLKRVYTIVSETPLPIYFIHKQTLKLFSNLRIDIKNIGSSQNFVHTVDTTATIHTPAWFSNAQGIGIVCSTSQKYVHMRLQTQGKGRLTLAFKGADTRAYGARIPIWITYSSICIDGQEILQSPVSTWHDKPFHYSMPVQDKQVVTITAKQKAYKYTSTDLYDLALKLCNHSTALARKVYCILSFKHLSFKSALEHLVKRTPVLSMLCKPFSILHSLCKSRPATRELVENLHTFRVDIKNYVTLTPTLEITSSSTPITKPSWFNKVVREGTGIVLECSEKSAQTTLRATHDGTLVFSFKGKDYRFHGTREPLWTTYASIKIDGKNIISSPLHVCHDKPYKYEMPVCKGQVVTLEVEQEYKKHTYRELYNYIYHLSSKDIHTTRKAFIAAMRKHLK